MRTFLIDNVTPRMAVDNAVYPISTSALAANIAHILFNAVTGIGSIEYNDRPSSSLPFTDPSPYQPFINTWLGLGAADRPPLQLAQAISIKQAIVTALYNYKRLSLTSTAGVTAWSTLSNGIAPSNDGYTVSGSQVDNSGSPSGSVTTDQPVVRGAKAYWEISLTGSQLGYSHIGVFVAGAAINHDVGGANSFDYYGSGWNSGDLIGVALDLVNNAIWFSRNGVWQNSATATEIAAGTTTHAAHTGLASTYYPAVSATNVNYLDAAFTGNFNGPFVYTPPAGFGLISTVTMDASDMGAISAALGVPNVVTPSPNPYSPNFVAHLQVAAAGSRQTFATTYQTIQTNLNACATIAAVIAFDITAGWP